jgi:hypothetical protein
MKVRFGSGLKRVSRSLLRFIAQTRFCYGVRSITHLIDTIAIENFDKNGVLRVGKNDLLIKDRQTLKFHLADPIEKVAKQWADVSNDDDIVILARPEESRSDKRLRLMEELSPIKFKFRKQYSQRER